MSFIKFIKALGLGLIFVGVAALLYLATQPGRLFENKFYVDAFTEHTEIFYDLKFKANQMREVGRSVKSVEQVFEELGNKHKYQYLNGVFFKDDSSLFFRPVSRRVGEVELVGILFKEIDLTQCSGLVRMHVRGKEDEYYYASNKAGKFNRSSWFTTMIVGSDLPVPILVNPQSELEAKRQHFIGLSVCEKAAGKNGKVNAMLLGL